MRNQRQASRIERRGRYRNRIFFHTSHFAPQSSGFTLIETMVAVTLLTIAIVAPMSLTAQSLSSAYYARDQITAFYLAEEAIEAVRDIRDNNILQNSQGTSVNLMNNIPSGHAFTIDTRNNNTSDSASSPTPSCPLQGGVYVCPPLETEGTLYGYGLGAPGWSRTIFTRSVVACYVHTGGTCDANASDEIKVTVTVSWQSGNLQVRSIKVSENLYRWVSDGSGT